MERARAIYVADLAKKVLTGKISASRAVVLSYMYDHPDATLEAAAEACGVPLSCAMEIAEDDTKNGVV
jgi:hypothetical protein